MNRRFIAGERIMYVDAATTVNCVFSVKIRGIIKEENIRCALIKLQDKYPLLRVKISEDRKRCPYFISDNSIQEIPVRVIDRYTDTDWETISKQEWAIPFALDTEPLMRVIILRSNEVSDLILVCPHCICDGSTFVALMRETLELIDCPTKDIGNSFAFNSVADYIPKHLSFGMREIFKFKFFSKLAILYFLLRKKYPKPQAGDSYFFNSKIDQEFTSKITAKCKLEKTSVHAALCIDYLRAFNSIKGNNAKGEVICPVDIRHLIPEIKEDTMFAFAPIVRLAVAKETNRDFWEEARIFKDDLGHKIDAIKIFNLLQLGEYFHKSIPNFVDILISKDSSHDITLSNMGRLNIPHQFSTFEVETVYSPTVAFPWKNPNTLVVSWFRGEMDFSFISNDAFLNKADAKAITKTALEVLSAETKSLG